MNLNVRGKLSRALKQIPDKLVSVEFNDIAAEKGSTEPTETIEESPTISDTFAELLRWTLDANHARREVLLSVHEVAQRNLDLMDQVSVYSKNLDTIARDKESAMLKANRVERELAISKEMTAIFAQEKNELEDRNRELQEALDRWEQRAKYGEV